SLRSSGGCFFDRTLEDSTAEMKPEEADLERATEDDDVGLPNPDLYRRLHVKVARRVSGLTGWAHC
ncbi:hypothetical protein, partial [Thiolapillus sp.]|uniref:hypothetical protein n=1 Tax=Thiolapillus sp. TaxID=2017437 RepID=UPI003AF8D783